MSCIGFFARLCWHAYLGGARGGEEARRLCHAGHDGEVFVPFVDGLLDRHVGDDAV